jgi:cytoskeletal protein RodZ
MRRSSLALALLLIAPLASAQVYKWTDAQGTTHYSETPPATGTKYSQVSVTSDTSTPASSDNSSAASSSSSQDSDSQSTQSLPDTPENRSKLCASLKTNMGTLQGTGPVVMQGPNGQQQLLNADQRKQQLDATQSQYQQYCNG